LLSAISGDRFAPIPAVRRATIEPGGGDLIGAGTTAGQRESKLLRRERRKVSKAELVG
jgi:hypothetical protein